MFEGGGGQVPKRSVKVRARGGGLHDIYRRKVREQIRGQADVVKIMTSGGGARTGVQPAPLSSERRLVGGRLKAPQTKSLKRSCHWMKVDA